MANFVATVTLEDSMNRQVTKRLETTNAILADAQAVVSLYNTDLLPCTDLGVVTVTYSVADDTLASAGELDSNCDTGATFRCRLDNGKIAAHKIPGFPLSLAGTGGAIDCADPLVIAYFANFEFLGGLRLSDGQYITAVLTGMMDK